MTEGLLARWYPEAHQAFSQQQPPAVVTEEVEIPQMSILLEEMEPPAAAAALRLQMVAAQAVKDQLALRATKLPLTRAAVAVASHRQVTPPARVMVATASRRVSLGQASIMAAVVVVVLTPAQGQVD